ncbi:protein trachealess [Condylostylus longicornis]|uniref:protein trachealess n=1 Tax=Condylostylus longicornis TaxID=2530218 RepID=UPI00244E0B3D|nr:protein trachealess [Condylostylus longicornis]
MLPYQAVAMDYAAAGYQRQPGTGIPGGPMTHHMGSLGMAGVGVSVGSVGSPFTHSWLVPTQDLCAVPYKQMPNQHHHQNSQMHPNQQIEPGILELRKEKSRDAARSRRGKENFEFYELAKMLPLPAAITSQLDKASIIRLTISYLKLRDFSGHGDPPWTREPSNSSKVLKTSSIRRSPAVDLFEQHQGTHILQSLDGFALAVAADGRFLYISETVSIYLGLSQVEMTGSSIFDYVHQQDHNEIAEQLGLSLANNQSGSSNGSNNNGIGLASPSSGASDEGGTNQGTNNPDVSASMVLNASSAYKGFDRAFCIRMKSTLTKRGCHFKSSGYRVVLMLCRLRPQYTFSHTRKSQPPLLGMVALAIALPPPSVHEIRLECDMFVTRINFDFRIAHCEPKVSDLLDYTPEELTGKNLYNLCHGEDAEKLRKCHLDLINKGQVLTHYYRIMNKNGGYTWLQTCATVVCSSKNADEQNIICVNYVVSLRENENLVLDCIQLEGGLDNLIKHEEIINDNNDGSPSCGGSGDLSVDHHSTVTSAVGNSNATSATTLEPQISPKIDPDLHQQQHRNRRNNSLSSIKDSLVVPTVTEEQQNLNISAVNNTPTVTTVTPIVTKRGHKRKMKVTDEMVAISIDPPKSSPAMSMHSNGGVPGDQTNDTNRSRHSSSVIEEHTESSVKDLENAMSKHLPSPTNGGNNPTTDFSTDALLKQQQQQQQQQDKLGGSTIQWIGTHHTHTAANPYQQPTPMPASALLRQLYANRESVIRATARQTPTGAVYYSNDNGQNGPLPTPPGSESSFDNQFLQLHSHHSQKTSADAFTNLVSTYGGYPHHSSIDYHNAMTPPSSVSPRDSTNLNSLKNSTQHSTSTANGYEYTTIDSLRGQYSTLGGSTGNGNGNGNNTGTGNGNGNSNGDANQSPTTPSLIKPQPYSAVAMHHAASTAAVAAAATIDPTTAAAAAAYGTLEQSQYFSPHSSFHLYHKGTPSAGWYTTPS